MVILEIHIVACSMMSQRGGVKWQKIPWRDTPIIMNDGQAISRYAEVLLLIAIYVKLQLIYYVVIFPC